jgi:D-alanyl-D-alanine carboxypeptidase (penicillin-binding protein 5/6)
MDRSGMIDDMHLSAYRAPVRPVRRHRGRRVIWLVVVLFVVYLIWSWIAIPASAFAGIAQVANDNLAPSAAPALSWPAGGQAAIGTGGHGILASHGEQTGVPIASVAKVMLALAVLNQRPISADGQGGTITISQTDVDSYSHWLAHDGSVVLVQAGEQISEYQALQALLLPSANNMADTLANWAFGSIAAYDSYANDFADGHGMTASHFADASGFDPATVSSASDLVKLGQLALKNSIISDIASQHSAVLPVAGTVYNVNSLLGKNGVVGLKTGNTDQAGGCLLFTANRIVGNHTVQVVGAVLAAPNLTSALSLSSSLLVSAQANFADTVVTDKGATLATYRLPWGESATAVADDNLHAISWGGNDVTTYNVLDKVHLPADKGQVIGKRVEVSNATATRTSVPIILDDELRGPSLWWRLTHPAKTWHLRFS